jgi:hypothetical protein
MQPNPFWPDAPLPTVDEADPRQDRLFDLMVEHESAKRALQEAYTLLVVDPAMRQVMLQLSSDCARLWHERQELVQDMAGHNRPVDVVPQVRTGATRSEPLPTKPEKPIQLSFLG